ncbi:MAG: glycine zipper 2TM domain-containing protein [Patescibacteria group bacterium]
MSVRTICPGKVTNNSSIDIYVYGDDTSGKRVDEKIALGSMSITLTDADFIYTDKNICGVHTTPAGGHKVVGEVIVTDDPNDQNNLLVKDVWTNFCPGSGNCEINTTLIVSGAIVGAVVGAGIGAKVGGGWGAVIGAGIGAIGGALISWAWD